jgi:stage II sporulation protein D
MNVRKRRAAWWSLVVLALSFVVAPTAGGDEIYPRPVGTTVTVRGHGWGHGIGMGQYGALGGARAGKTWREVVAHYYRGTTVGSVGSPVIRVRVASLGTTVQALPSPGLRVTWDFSTSSVLPTTRDGATVTRWRLRPATKIAGTDTRFLLEYLVSGSSTWRLHTTGSVVRRGAFLNPDSGTVTTLRGTTQVVYRGQVRGVLVGAAGAESLVPVVALPLEQYLRSVVPAEMPSSWPSTALSAQAVAARTYAEYHRRYAPLSATWYDVYDDTRSQVFPGTRVGGVVKEFTSTTAAVQATAGLALFAGDRLALTMFSSSTGGYTADGGRSYLTPVPDPWDAVTGNANHSWEVAVPITRIESAYPSVGRLTGLRITSRNGRGALGGRVVGMTVVGSAGSVATTGSRFRSAIGLKSDWFTPRGAASEPSFPRDVTADRHADVLAVLGSTGTLRVYPSTGSGTWGPMVSAGSGWTAYAKVLTAGTWDVDGVSDVLVQDTAGRLFLRRGRGDGTFASPVQIGTGWQIHNLVLPVGDFDGDGFTDLIARRGDGNLFLYSGNGAGGFRRTTQIGTGWQGFTALLGAGDITGDGNVDVLARRKDGTVRVYAGDGAGYWRLPATTAATGWAVYTALTAPGDFTGDGEHDIIARKSDGTLWVIPGTGTGGFGAARQVGTDWNAFSRILP